MHLITPAIGLKRLANYSTLGKFDEKIKCQTKPANVTSTTYKIRMVYFKDRTLEEWFLYKNCLIRCLDYKAGQLAQLNFHWLGDYCNATRLQTTKTREHCLQYIHV